MIKAKIENPSFSSFLSSPPSRSFVLFGSHDLWARTERRRGTFSKRARSSLRFVQSEKRDSPICLISGFAAPLPLHPSILRFLGGSLTLTGREASSRPPESL